MSLFDLQFLITALFTISDYGFVYNFWLLLCLQFLITGLFTISDYRFVYNFWLLLCLQFLAKRKKDNRTNNDIQSIAQKNKDPVSRIPLKTRSELRCSGKVGSSCSTNDTFYLTNTLNMIFIVLAFFLLAILFPVPLWFTISDYRFVYNFWLPLCLQFLITGLFTISDYRFTKR
jgi:hypothetical protein